MPALFGEYGQVSAPLEYPIEFMKTKQSRENYTLYALRITPTSRMWRLSLIVIVQIILMFSISKRLGISSPSLYT